MEDFAITAFNSIATSLSAGSITASGALFIIAAVRASMKVIKLAIGLLVVGAVLFAACMFV